MDEEKLMQLLDIQQKQIINLNKFIDLFFQDMKSQNEQIDNINKIIIMTGNELIKHKNDLDAHKL